MWAACEKLEHGRRKGYIGRMKRILILAVVLLAFGTLLGGNGPGVSAQRMDSLATFSREALTIRSGDKTHKFSVELALNSRQHAQGLMFRRRMAQDAGMLFVYRREESTAMWMKNTFIPLDMLFISRDGTVRRIAERTVPMSEVVIPSGGPVVAVLELNAGTASRLGLKPGDKVISTSLRTAR
ncbi:MAG: uncharacterized membrane protein (UPF0127 family) [Paracoccaceae bacterium]|jgi:uncharacterized membrane protein (UPF0127 family)